MKYLNKLCVAAVVLVAVFAFCKGSQASGYEMVRQGSSGETVQRVQIRLRELDYLHFKPTGSFKAMTVSATIAFQKMQVTDEGSWVAADGEAGDQTQSILFSAKARRASILSTVHMPIGPALGKTPSAKGSIVSWQKVKEQLAQGKTYKVFDYNTGKSFKVKYYGGENHAEVECVSAEDTATFIEVFGGEYNYSKRAIVFQLDSDTMIAASMFGFPHGTDFAAGNDIKGHICIFFDGSKSHVGNVADVEHQKQIYTAAGM